MLVMVSLWSAGFSHQPGLLIEGLPAWPAGEWLQPPRQGGRPAPPAGLLHGPYQTGGSQVHMTHASPRFKRQPLEGQGVQGLSVSGLTHGSWLRGGFMAGFTPPDSGVIKQADKL